MEWVTSRAGVAMGVALLKTRKDMKKLILFILLLTVTTLNSQAIEQNKVDKNIKLLSIPINTGTELTPAVMDVIDRVAIENKIRKEVQAEMAAACDERQLAIEKMKLEIECRGITPGELGIAPDTICVGLGLYSEWIVRAISNTRIGGTYTALLDPATSLSTPGPSGTLRSRTIVGFDKFIPVGTVIIMAEK